MKKLKVMFLAGVMAFSLVACGDKKEETKESTVETTEVLPERSPEKKEPLSAVKVLQNIWNNYDEDQKFPIAGGDMSPENNKMDAVGVFSLADPEAVDVALGLPASQINNVGEAASITHMMNANTFTCAAFYVKDGTGSVEVSNDIVDNLRKRQWVCGMPDKYVVADVEGYVVSFFGEQDLVEYFVTKMCATYPESVILSEGDL